MDDLQHKINKLIEAKRLTKTEFSKKLGISYDAVYNLSYNSIKFSVLVKISEIFDTPITHFLPEDTKKATVLPSETEKNCQKELLKLYKELNEARKKNEELMGRLLRLKTSLRSRKKILLL